MAIRLRCSNGHLLRVKEKFAGKSGLCPYCHVRVNVPHIKLPQAHSLSDEEILDIMGPPPAVTPLPDYADEDESTEVHVLPDAEKQPNDEGSGISLVGSSMLKRKKFCPECARIVSYSFKWCPGCGSLLSGSQTDQPQSEAEQDD